MATKMQAGQLEVLDGDATRGRMKRQRADRDYLISHYQELLGKYRNQWVVISEGGFVMAEENPDRLLETLARTPRDNILVYYLADPEEAMLLYDTR